MEVVLLEGSVTSGATTQAGTTKEACNVKECQG